MALKVKDILKDKGLEVVVHCLKDYMRGSWSRFPEAKR
jgi:hypothetical protein